MTATHERYPFHVEWLTDAPQHYHGPRQRMRQTLAQCHLNEKRILDQQAVVRWLLNSYSQSVRYFQKLKFYEVPDDTSRQLLRFFILWCGDSIAVRERMFEDGPRITQETGWYPMVTGRRYFHHQNAVREFTERGLRKAMNRAAIERQIGLGSLIDLTKLAKAGGTSILLRTSTSDIVLDAGLAEAELQLSELRTGVRKWLFISHAHGDHVGGSGVFVRDRKFVIAAGAITLELLLASIDRNSGLNDSVPGNFFYRLAPMWYGATYHFGDGSSVQPVPTYHFPGSMGFLFRFADGTTLVYTGDVNVRGAYVAHKLSQANGWGQFDVGPRRIDIAIVEAAFIGRNIGRTDDSADSIIQRIARSIESRRHVFLLTPPGDYGLYLFLHLYDRVISKPRRTIDTRLFLDPLILSQIALIEWRMKRKQVGSLDDACRAWLATRSTLGESVRVFDFTADPSGNVNELVRRGMKGVFILDDRRAALPDYCPESVRKCLESDGLDVVLVGKAATVAAGEESMAASESFGAGPWLLHSSETELANYLLAGPQQFAKVYLFHNFPRRLDKFAKRLKERGFPGTITAL